MARPDGEVRLALVLALALCDALVIGVVIGWSVLDIQVERSSRLLRPQVTARPRLRFHHLRFRRTKRRGFSSERIEKLAQPWVDIHALRRLERARKRRAFRTEEFERKR